MNINIYWTEQNDRAADASLNWDLWENYFWNIDSAMETLNLQLDWLMKAQDVGIFLNIE